MKKILLSEVEVNDLLDLYQSEIDRAQRRINNLKTIIKKLSTGHSVSTEEKPIKTAGRRGRKPKTEEAKVLKETKEITKEPKKRGRKKKVVEAKIEPKKRGRKPKTKEVEIKNANATKEIKEKVITKEPKKAEKKGKTSKIKPEPKKRGRKPIVSTAEVATAEAKVTKTPKEVKEKAITKKTKKAIRKKKTAKVKAAPKKRGRKPKSLRKPIKGGKGKEKVKWNDFIVETITSKDSLMLASSITQAALEKFEIPASDRDRVRMAISTTLTKMANKDKLLGTYTQSGIRGAFFGLAKWFNEKAELNSEYQKKLM